MKIKQANPQMHGSTSSHGAGPSAFNRSALSDNVRWYQVGPRSPAPNKRRKTEATIGRSKAPVLKKPASTLGVTPANANKTIKKLRLVWSAKDSEWRCVPFAA